MRLFTSPTAPCRRLAHAVCSLAAISLIAASPAAASFSEPVVVTDEDTAEPGIDVAPDGTLYINAPSGLLSNLPGSPSFVFRSDNGGASWQELPTGLRALFPGGGDVDISLDPETGALALTDLWLGSSTVATSDDKGESWLAQPFQGVPVQDRQWVAQVGGGVVYHVTNQIPLGLMVSKSTDGGLLYPISTLAASVLDRTGCICPPGTLIAESGGSALGMSDRVGVIYATSTGGMGFARSTNGGLTFTQVEISPASDADTAQAFPVVANAGGDRLAAVWLEVAGDRTVVKLATSSNWGESWSPPRNLVDSGTPVFPWLDARGSKIAVSVYHTADAEATPGTVPEEAQWFEKYLESTDGGVTFSGLEIVDPVPVKTGPICTEGIDCAEDRELLDFQAVALDGDDLANVTWTRSIDGEADTETRFAKQE